MASQDDLEREVRDQILGLVETLIPQAVEVRKTHIAMWDKLVILDAAILTISLSAATAFRGHVVGDGGVGYLFAAWRYLLMSIVFSVGAQWLTAFSTEHLVLAINMKLVSERAGRLKAAGVRPFDTASVTMDASSKVQNRAQVIAWKSAAVVGYVGMMSMFFALLDIVRFGRVNLPSFLTH